MATREKQQEAMSPGEYIELLEQTRGRDPRGRVRVVSGDRRPAQQGTDRRSEAPVSLGRATGTTGSRASRYLHTEDKEVRRKQLRKLIDEGGQTTVGGDIPSHPELSRLALGRVRRHSRGDRPAGERGRAPPRRW